MSEPAATLASRRTAVRLIVDEHRLRERIVAVVREGEQHVVPASRQADLARAAVQHQMRRLTALATNFEIPPSHAEAQAGAERFRRRLLRREARREMRHA